MKSKLAIKLFSAVSLLLSLQSCSKEETKFFIGVSQCSADDWRSTANQEMIREATFLSDINIEIRSVEDNSADQIADIEYFIKNNVDLLVVSPNEGDSLTAVIEKAYDSGIPVILFDRKINSDKYTAYVGADNYQIGMQMGLYMIGKKPDKTNIVIIRGTPGSTPDEERYKGLTDALSRAEHSEYHIVKELVGDFLTSSAKNEMSEFLRTTDDEHIDAVLAFNDAMAYGAREALAEAHIVPLPTILGIDALYGPKGGMSMVANGTIDASFIYPTGGEDVIIVAENILKGLPYDRENSLVSAAVDNSNVHVLMQQLSQIDNQQRKVDTMTEKNTIISSKVGIQKQNFIYLLLLTVLVALLAIVLLQMYFRSKNLNQKLKEKNEHIQSQMEALEEQEKQTLMLSKELEESTQAKLVFFTNISHEFKTPLSLINGPISDLVKRDEFSPEVHKLLSIIYRNSSRLNRLITELLDFRAYENSKVSLNYSLGDLKAFLLEIASLFDEAMESKGIDFSFTSSDDDFTIPFDPVKMEKVFTNLMSNAYNHVDEGGRIRVSISFEEKGPMRHFKLEVYNSGSFIPEEERQNIFRRFYTIDSRRGTGVGLALITAIIDAFNGTIDVESVEDDGTTFKVDIPLDETIVTDVKLDEKSYVPDFANLKIATIDSPEVEYDIVEDMERQAGRRTVLVVEDNKDMRLYLKSILSSEYKVIFGKDGEEGTEKALSLRPDIIISDVFMPKKDGFQFCKDIKHNNITENIPVILLTAASSDEHWAHGYECGADAFIKKPFNDHTLKVRMRTLLEKQKSIDERFSIGFIPDASRVNVADDSKAFLCKFREYVEDHIDEDISLEQIAEHFSFSKSKLYRILRGITDYSPVDLVNLIRLNHAIDIMTKEHCNINEAAFRCGFTSASYFSRAFQKYYNERPTAYIKRKNSTLTQ